MKRTGILIEIGTLRMVSQRLGKEAGRVGNRRTNRGRLDNNIAEIDENTEKSPGDLRRLFVTRTPVKDLQLVIV